MQRLLILTATSAVFALVAAPAHAAVTQSLTGVSYRPANAGTKLAPAKSNLLLDSSVTETSGGKLPVADRLILDLDKNVQLMGRFFPSCSGEKLTQGQQSDLPACRSAKMGTAVASANIYQPDGSPSGTISFNTNLYNGPRGRQLIAYVVIPGTSVQAAMIGTISRVGSPYGTRVTFVIPAQLKQPLPNVFPSLQRFKLTRLQRTTSTVKSVRVGTRTVRRKVGYLESTGCTSRSFNLRVTYDFTPPAPNVSATAKSPCTR